MLKVNSSLFSETHLKEIEIKVRALNGIALKMDVVKTSKTSVNLCNTAGHNIPKGSLHMRSW
jgi:hypothetical protein